MLLDLLATVFIAGFAGIAALGHVLLIVAWFTPPGNQMQSPPASVPVRFAPA